MMSYCKRLIAVLLTVVMLVSALPLYTVSAASTYYQTAKANVPIWSAASSKSTKVTTVAASGTVMIVVGSTVNSSGNTWYQLNNGNWVYSGNIKKHSHSYSGGICNNNTCRYQWAYSISSASGSYEICNTSGGKIWSRPYSTNSTNVRLAPYRSLVTVIGKTENQEGNTWYKLSDGNWVYSGNIKKHSHSYSGGICTNGYCNYQWPYTVTSVSATYVVTNKDGAKIWSRPYSVNSTNMRRSAYKAVLKVNGKTKNKDGNTWFRLSDGNWVYSGNVTRRYTVSFNANGGKNAPSAQYVLKGKSLKLSTKKPTRVGYVFRGWATSSSASAVKYKAGTSYSFSSNTTLYAVWKKCLHSYNGGICKTCGHEYSLVVAGHSATYVVTNKDGAKIWSRPYSVNSTNMRRSAYKAVLKVNGKTKNEDGNTWFRLSDGNWVYSGNVTRRYTVSFNANGGKSAPSTQYVLSGKTLTLSSAKPTKSGYIFQGWATSASSKVVKFKPGKSYKLTANQKLYAVWGTCSHKYNNKGICAKCNKEKPFTYESLGKRVYKIKASTTTITTYSRPFEGCKTSLKVTEEDLVQVVGVATVDSSKWYKLSNNHWIPGSNATYYAKYSNGKLVYNDSSYAKKITTVETIPQDTTPAEDYLAEKVNTIHRAALIPGLMKTVTRNKNGNTVTTCNNMVPQGLTFADDYMLISAYCACGAKHRSVIYVLDNATRHYQTTLILDDYCHVGGLAKQGNYIWVCDTGTATNKEKLLRAYRYSDIENAINLGANYWTLDAAAEPQVKCSPSYICSANGYLYVGTHHEDSTKATIHYYSVSGKSIEWKGSFKIDGIKQIQGISIRGNSMVITSSYGRKNDDNSKVYVFKDAAGFKTKDKTYYEYNAANYEFANMVEGCYIGSSFTYFICESGAKKYRGSDDTRPLDKYVGFKNSVFGIS